MKLAKVKSVVLSKALEDYLEFSALHMYLSGIGGFERDAEGNFISKIVNYSDTPELELKLALSDYLFNEYQEYDKLWELAEKLLGKKTIDIEILKIVEI